MVFIAEHVFDSSELSETFEGDKISNTNHHKILRNVEGLTNIIGALKEDNSWIVEFHLD